MGELSKYRLLLNPWGDEIQTPKMVEALLVLTIPIQQRGPSPIYDDLLSYGFPLVVVDEWYEITGDKLDAWWRVLSPRLESFRSNCLSTSAYWSLITGHSTS